MALPRIRPKNPYAINCFQDSVTTILVSIDKGTGYIIHVNDSTRSGIPWQEGHNNVEEVSCSKQEAHDNDFIARGDSETVLINESVDILIDKYYMPTESELRQAQLLNIPTRGFCVSADLEELNADSYLYSQDSEEFAPPII